MTTANRSGENVGAVLVHGLWHGGWVWDTVRRELDVAGIASAVVELPMTDLGSDVAATRHALDEFDRPAVLVGHSYGGAVITGAGTHRHVAHLLYLAAFQLAEGESIGRVLPQLGIPPTRLSEALRFSDDRAEVGLDPALATALLYGDAPAETAANAVTRLCSVHRPVFSGVPEEIGWHDRPSTYIVCTEDQTVHPDLQRAMATRATHRHEWVSGHSPNLSRPATVAGLIASIAARQPA